MSDDTEPDKEPLSVKLAQANVTDPEVYRKAQELEKETALNRIEAEQKRAEERSLAGIVARELAKSLEPSDLVPLIKVVAKAFAKTGDSNETVQAQQQNGTGQETETGVQESPAKQAVTGDR
jgi:hypothetical protein